MANILIPKHGEGVPAQGILKEGEIGIAVVNGAYSLYTGNADGEAKPVGLPITGGTLVASGDAGGHLKIPGANSALRLARDNAGIFVSYGGQYTPALSIKTQNSSWDIGSYNNGLRITKFLDTDYNSDSNIATKDFQFTEDGISGLQNQKLLVNGTLTSESGLSGTASMSLYKTIYVLLGQYIGSTYYYTSFALPFLTSSRDLYLPTSSGSYQGKIAITSPGRVAVSLSTTSVTCYCYVYAGL